MARNKKPVIIVALVLTALIVLPLVAMLLARMGYGPGGAAVRSPGNPNGSSTAVVDFDLRQLADRVDSLMENDLADALREGDLSLQVMADLNRELERARSAMSRGQLDRAEALYREILASAEARLEGIALAEKARALQESTYAELRRVEHLKSSFGNTYREAVAKYDAALAALNAGNYAESVDNFELSNAILGDLEARAVQQVGGILETARAAMDAFDLPAARAAFEEALKVSPENEAARNGLETLQPLEGIVDEVKAVKALERSGNYEAAIEALEELIERHPENPYLQEQRAALEQLMEEQRYAALIKEADAAEDEGDFLAAIDALEAALEIRSGQEEQKRLEDLKAKDQATRLNTLLETGYDALNAGRYESARQIYREAVALAPESKEARTGLEKASSLYLANIRYAQNLEAAAKYIKEGRFPLAGKFFNDAMASRPSRVVDGQLKEETRLRSELEAQAKEVPVTVLSDGKTYVSIIGVLPPDRFREKELNLFPDVYTIKGTRSGYKDVEIELKVNARDRRTEIEVKCTEQR